MHVMLSHTQLFLLPDDGMLEEGIMFPQDKNPSETAAAEFHRIANAYEVRICRAC